MVEVPRDVLGICPRSVPYCGVVPAVTSSLSTIFHLRSRRQVTKTSRQSWKGASKRVHPMSASTRHPIAATLYGNSSPTDRALAP